MSILDTIEKARQMGASDEQILSEIQKANPGKAAVFEQAKKLGADSSMVLGEFMKQNQPTPYSQQVMGRLQTNAQSVGEGFMSAGTNIKKDLTNILEASKKPGFSLFERGAQSGQELGKIGGEIVKATGSVIGGVAGFFGSLVPDSWRKQLSGGVQKVLNGQSSYTPEEMAAFKADPEIQKTRQRIETIINTANENPEVKDAAINLVNTLILKAGDVKVPELKPTLSTIKSEASAGYEAIKDVGIKTLDITKGGVTKTTDAISNKIKGKTLEQVLATPEEKLYTLNAEQRAAFFANERSQAEILAKNEANKLASEFATKKQALTTAEEKLQASFKAEAENLSKQLAEASRDEVLRLRPKIIESMRVQSNNYRKIVDSEIAKVGDLPINGDEIAQYIESRFINNPTQIEAIKSRLGLNNTAAKPVKGDLPVIQTQPTTKTLTAKDIYNKTKELGQEIKTPIKSGGSTFTPEQKLTDDAISTLVEFLKTKGADLSKARQFWAGYAPVRNQLVKEAKPFLATDIGTKTFADRLIKVAKGKDINNANFIAAVEDLVGEKIGVNIKKILKKLTDNQKAMLAKKVETETKLMELALEKKRVAEVSALGKQYSKINQVNREFEITRKAKTRTIFLRALKGIGSIAGLGVLGKFYYQ